MLIEFQKKTENQTIERAYEHNANHAFISSQNDYLSKYLSNINLNDHRIYHFTSNGRFAMHDIAIYLANQIERPDVVFTSFNISKDAARQLLRAYDRGIFNSMKFVLNAQKKSNFKAALAMIEGKFDIQFTKIHAKCALLSTQSHKVSIITSGNLSSNNNIERGFITTNHDVYEFDRRWTEPLFQPKRN